MPPLLNMPEIREARPEDFEAVLPLLSGLAGDRPVPAEHWRRLFKHRFGNDDSPLGFVLWDGDKPGGYIGLIFSWRTVAGRKEKVANLTSWIVLEDYRKFALLLFLKVSRLQGVTLTNFTPTESVVDISKKFGFEILDDTFFYIPPLPWPLGSNPNGLQMFSVPEEFHNKLTEEEVIIFNDHRLLSCYFCLASTPAGNCFVIFSRKIKNHLPFGYVHYIGDPAMFARCAGALSRRLSFRHGLIGLFVYSRHFEGLEPAFFKKIKIANPRLYRSETMTPGQIDGLYSELVLLDF